MKKYACKICGREFNAGNNRKKETRKMNVHRVSHQIGQKEIDEEFWEFKGKLFDVGERKYGIDERN